ncbi:uncharacterized protein CDAR_372961 [Caerostris darwini]|uniref:Uncharacterized protein n=1 Tax=Caerostris darwini TaxID=1538125 RepID=A0AAV4SUQ3_9ARAC|nr:uncharacterized protein CDAR_372961 [Caerostris darwini]
MKLFLAIVLLAFAADQAYSQACHLREVDLCIAIGMFHFQSNGIPPDEDKINEWCETVQEVTECMGNFTNKCLSPLQKELMGLLSGSDEIGKQFCTAGSEIRANYLTHAECLADGAESDDFKTQLKDIQVMVEKLFDVPFKQRFPLMCCGFRRFHVKTEAMTAKRCGEASVQMIRNIMKMIVTDLPDIVCQRFDPNSDECKALLPPTGTPSKGADNNSQIGKLMDTVFGNL